MGKTLYLIKQTVPDTTTDASTNADTILNTVLDAMKDLSNSQVENLLTYNPELSDTHSVTLYENSAKTTQLLKNSDIFVDMFDQQYAVLVSEYQKQTTWDGNDASFSDGLVTHTTVVGYSPAVNKDYNAVTSIDPASAPLYDATLFITTDEVNTVYTEDNRYRVIFDTDVSGRYQVFKAINSASYRKDGTSGLKVEEVAFNAYAGLSETFIVRDASNALALDNGSNSDHKLTENNFTLEYSWDTDVSYGSFKVVQEPTQATIESQQIGSFTTDVSTNLLHIRDASGFGYLVNSIDQTGINSLFSDSGTLSAGYSISITRTSEGGYYFTDSESITTDDNNITLDDTALVSNENYMKLVTNQTDASLVSQALLWNNGTVTASGTYAGSVTIGTEAESLSQTDSAADGIITFTASDQTYSSSSSAHQRSEPLNWNNYDTLSVDYVDLDNYYKQYQYHDLETRVLLPSTNTNTLLNNYNPYSNTLGTASTGRYIDACNNLVFFKSDSNNTSIDPNNITVTTNGIYDASNINSVYATIFEIGSERAFTNQSTLLEAEIDGSYVEVPGSIVSIMATNVVVPSATDYRFKMNPKKIDGNSDSCYNFPAISGGFNFVALDSSNQTYAATNYLETLKSNMNIFGNNIYNIMNNNASVELNIQYTTNETAINADSLKNFFDISYSFTISGVTTTGTHRIEDLERMTIIDANTTSTDVSYGVLSSSDISGSTPTSMVGWKIHQIEEETTFQVRTQLYLGAYSNLYIVSPVLRQTDTRYELRTAAGVAKPDYYLKYVKNYNVTAVRSLEIASSNAAIPVNTVTLSVNDLKSHIGDIQYTTGVADSDNDNNWETVAGPQDVDPNFDTANIYSDNTNGEYKVFIDVPKTYTLDAVQYIIRMQADPTSTTITGRQYADDDAIFTTDSYAWDMTTSSLTTGGSEIVGLTITYVTDLNNDVTMRVFHNGTELFNIVHNGDIVQNIRVIHNPRGIVETISWTNESNDDTWTYFGTISGNNILYEYDNGLTFQLDHRFRDTYSTTSYWTLTQDVATMQRVIGNANYYDLSGQTIDQDYTHSLIYGGSDSAKSVTFTYYRGNANGTASTININRTRSTLTYVMQTTNGTSTNGSYGDVWTGFTQSTVPQFNIDGLTVSDFGLQIDGISNSILSGSFGQTYYYIDMNFDVYTITESNPGSSVHNGTTIGYAENYILFTFTGTDPIMSGFVATTIKSPIDETYTISSGTTNVYVYYSPVFLGHADDINVFPDASWSLLSTNHGIMRDSSHNIGTVTNPVSYTDMGNGIYLNNGAIFLQRNVSGTDDLTGYFVCPPPQLKVTGVVITSNATASYHGSIDSKPTLQRYNPSIDIYKTQSYYVDVNQPSLGSTYYPFANFVSDTSYFMNNLALYEYDSEPKSIKTYRDSQSYSETVDIKENKFSIFEYSGMYMSDTSSNTPYDEVDGSYVVLNSDYLSNLSSVYGTVSIDASYASYTIGIKQNKYPLTLVGGSRYSYENLSFTIGSPFLLETDLNYYATESYANRWVPVNTTGPNVLPLEFNVGNSTRLTLYGTNFTYSGSNIILRLKKYSTNFGIDYSNFPRELTSVYLFAKNKAYKEISLTRTQLTDANTPDDSTSAEDANAELIRQTLLSVSWTDYEYETDSFTPGKVRFELIPALSYIYDSANMTDVSASLVNAGAREILSILAVTEDEPRNILFMNLEDSFRSYDGSTYGKYLPKSITSYSGQSVDRAIPASQDGSAYVIPMKEKFGDTQSVYDQYGH